MDKKNFKEISNLTETNKLNSSEITNEEIELLLNLSREDQGKKETTGNFTNQSLKEKQNFVRKIITENEVKQKLSNHKNQRNVILKNNLQTTTPNQPIITDFYNLTNDNSITSDRETKNTEKENKKRKREEHNKQEENTGKRQRINPISEQITINRQDSTETTQKNLEKITSKAFPGSNPVSQTNKTLTFVEKLKNNPTNQKGFSKD
ncbi:MAG TPA: hypothetical protein VLL98_01510 [Rickettsiales bacterium]|nr:hypothetical protein [Rickettsiales bacterium]